MKYLSSHQFKTAAQAGTAADAGIRKSFLGIPETNTSNRQVRFTISTDTVDRDNDTINQKGWDLKDFRKNSVFLWSHESDQPPIGKVVEIGLEGGALKATVEFVPADNPWIGAKAEGAFQMCQQGFLSAVSVGFQPTEWELSTDKARGADGWNPGVDYLKQTLFELSLCPVPANPEALIEQPSIEAPKSIESAADITVKLNKPNGKRQRILALLEVL